MNSIIVLSNNLELSTYYIYYCYIIVFVGTPMGSNSTLVTFTDKIVLTVMNGSEGKCRIVCDCTLFPFMHISLMMTAII